ncbi:MAG: hypothetical protein CMF50_09300 [Legionellales bacterium]|nr:hypothetical protein [Legionellales bacterium]|tara:strand:- start:6774 stop:7064 length:291 start_codon:yes stop_codon:yes gene_type:complete
MRIISYILLIVVILVGLTFACLNADPVTINYYVGSSTVPLSFLLVLAFCLGALIALAVSSLGFLRLKRNNYQLKQRIKMREREVDNLRAIPIKDDH